MKKARPKRQVAVDREAGASAGEASGKRLQSRGDMNRLDPRIRIDKEEDFAAGDVCAGVTHSRNLPPIHRHDAGRELMRDSGRLIGGSVVHHDQLVGFFVSVGGADDGAQSFRQFALFVMCGNDERQFYGFDSGRVRKEKFCQGLNGEGVSLRPLTGARAGDIEDLDPVGLDELSELFGCGRRGNGGRINR